MRLLYVMAVCFFMAGCVSSSNLLPTRDKILRINATDEMIIAESEKYTYRFIYDDTREEYVRYKQFYNKYKDSIEGVSIHFYAKRNSKVIAEYSAIVDTNRLTQEEITALREKYNKRLLKNTYKTVVVFTANGYYIDNTANEIDDAFALEHPITISISNKTTTVDSGWSDLVVPFFPLVMLYGCIVGRCI